MWEVKHPWRFNRSCWSSAVFGADEDGASSWKRFHPIQQPRWVPGVDFFFFFWQRHAFVMPGRVCGFGSQHAPCTRRQLPAVPDGAVMDCARKESPSPAGRCYFGTGLGERRRRWRSCFRKQLWVSPSRVEPVSLKQSKNQRVTGVSVPKRCICTKQGFGEGGRGSAPRYESCEGQGGAPRDDFGAQLHKHWGGELSSAPSQRLAARPS